jgi:methyl-accepting chemotaxis protein
MLKGLNDNNAVHKSLQKKQAIDFISIFISYVALYFIVEYVTLTRIITIITLTLLFVAIVVIMEGSRRYFKNALQKTFDEISDETTDGTRKIEGVVDSQKDNINSSVLKVMNIRNVIRHSQEFIKAKNEVVGNTHNRSIESLEFANTENLAVKANIEKMFTLRHKIQTIAELILELSDFIQSISSTIGVVEDIAEQTNLLALNAAVEAARAGEHGKGFAVVAGEIRKLADESKQATAKISALISDIQQTTNSTVMATEEGTKEIESGINLANNIGENIEQLISAMNEITKGVQEVMDSWEKISDDAKNIDGFAGELNLMLEENHKITEENYKYVEGLNNLTKTYRTFVKED